MSNNGTGEAWSLAAWEQHATQIIQLTDNLAVKAATIDVLSLFKEDKEKINPLLTALQQVMAESGKNASAQQIGSAFLSDSEKLFTLSDMLDKVVIHAVISPPIKEAGNPDGLSIKRIPLAAKFKIFWELAGGEAQIGQLAKFHEESTGSMVVRPASETIRETT